MQMDLKIEILKVFSLTFSFRSDEKEKKDEKASTSTASTSK